MTAAEDPEVRIYIHGLPEERPRDGQPHPGESPATAVVEHGGLKFMFRFAPGDFTGDGELQAILIQPAGEPLTARTLRRVVPPAELYLELARARMRWMPVDTENWDEDLARRNEAIEKALVGLRQIGGPGRGLSDEFYRGIARHYDALVDGAEPHPIKTIGEVHHVTISAASRWVKEAKRRGYVTAS